MSLYKRQCQRLVATISRHHLGATDDGRSDLSLALTAQYDPALPAQALPAFWHLVYVYLAEPAPAISRSALVASFTFLRQLSLTRVERWNTPPQGVYLAPALNGRCLYVVLPRAHPARRDLPPGSRRRGPTLLYGFSAANALRSWASTHAQRVHFTSDELAAARTRTGGHVLLHVQTTPTPHVTACLAQGLGLDDLDRLRDSYLIPSGQASSALHQHRFDPAHVLAVVQLALDHALDVLISSDGGPPIPMARVPHQRLAPAVLLPHVLALLIKSQAPTPSAPCLQLPPLNSSATPPNSSHPLPPPGLEFSSTAPI
jgi:hypothetical protein